MLELLKNFEDTKSMAFLKGKGMRLIVYFTMWLGSVVLFPLGGVFGEIAAPAQTPMPVKNLPDIVLGDAHAPLTITMYFAPTCNHCADYEQTILPEIRKDFIESGKVRFIMRLLPFHRLDYTVAKLIWSRGEDKIFENIQLFLSHQKDWLEPALEEEKERKKQLKEKIAELCEEMGKNNQELMQDLFMDFGDEDAFLKLFALKNGFSLTAIHKATEENPPFEEALTANHLQASKDFGKSLEFVPAFLLNNVKQEGWVRPKQIRKALKKIS